jgi:hypothetical protein
VPQWIKRCIKFERHHVSRLQHPAYSPEISLCDFWSFGISRLKDVLKDCEFNSRDEIEDIITKVCIELTFDKMQSVFHNWMNRLAWIIENGIECITE